MEKAELHEIGGRIQYRRRQLGYTQEKLAEMMDVSVQMISNLERGNKAIRIDNLIRLCHILHTSSDYILTGANTGADNSDLVELISKLNISDRRMIEMLINYCINEKQP